ncbi:MAG: RCC1 domain-containing protein [Polyangiaceae bacterium]
MKGRVAGLACLVLLVPGCFGRVSEDTDSWGAGGNGGAAGGGFGGTGVGGEGWTDTGPAPTGTPLTVTVGQDKGCALRADGRAACWTLEGSEYTAAEDVPGLPSGLHSVAVGDAHGCALTGHGSVFCWGSASHGQNGASHSSAKGRELESLHGQVNQLSAGAEHNCALDREGAVWCWGAGGHGQLGNGAFKDSAAPVRVQGLSGAAQQVVAGADWSCALLETGVVECWGSAAYGNLGQSVKGDSAKPVMIRIEDEVTSLSEASGDLACVILADSRVRCWGRYSNAAMPVVYGDVGPIVGFKEPDRVAWIATGGVQACGLLTSGHVTCWTRDDGPRWRPAPEDATDVSAGGAFSCARNPGGVWCWSLVVDEQNLIQESPATRIEL